METMSKTLNTSLLVFFCLCCIAIAMIIISAFKYNNSKADVHAVKTTHEVISIPNTSSIKSDVSVSDYTYRGKSYKVFTTHEGGIFVLEVQ